MSATNFNLRGIPANVMIRLKEEAKKNHQSVNSILIRIIQDSMGFSTKTKKHTYHELDKLAGTWSAKDAKTFAQNNKYFETIDKDIWK